MMKQQLFLLLFLLFVFCVSCREETTSKALVYKDCNAKVTARVDDLISRMTLEEKVAQMCQFVGIKHIQAAENNLSKEEMEKSDAQGFYPGLHSSEIEQMILNGMIGSFLHVLDVNEANRLQKLALQSRLQIPLLIGIDAIHGTGLVQGATVYPTSIGLASTWDTTLVHQLSVETAREMRASGSAWTFTPNIDIARDARWGRVGETFGEDPFLVSTMGVAMIKGLQGKKPDGTFETIACAKHLIAGSQSVNGLNGAPTDLSERTIREVFLPPYKAAINAGVYSMMTAHNELNGIPCHADEWMMSDVIRDELGFQGFYVSDWMDIERLATRHYVAENQKEACFQTIEAGMDMHMHGPNFIEPVLELVKEGRLSEARIDESVRRILEAKFRLGLFEKPVVSTGVTAETLFNKEHQATALEAAQKSIVLLKNSDQLLPLSKKRHRKIFITGPNANNETILGDWSVKQPANRIETVLEGISAVSPEAQVDFLDVGSNLHEVDHKYVEIAQNRASKADVAIVVVGENSFRWTWNDKTCGENAARSDLGLYGVQKEIVEAVCKSGTPTIVVFVNGRPLATEWIAEHIPAIVEAWEPGCMGGKAVAQILFGEVNPSAKLPISIPRSAGHQLSVYNHKPSHYFHKYVTTKTGPLFPFGYGLSYTTFNYQNLALSNSKMDASGSIILRVDVRNIGKVAGDEIVQFYIRDNVSSVTRPVKELKGFQRIHLEPGETSQVIFKIQADMLSFLGKDMKTIIEPGMFTAMVGGSSLDADLQSIPFEVK